MFKSLKIHRHYIIVVFNLLCQNAYSLILQSYVCEVWLSVTSIVLSYSINSQLTALYERTLMIMVL